MHVKMSSAFCFGLNVLSGHDVPLSNWNRKDVGGIASIPIWYSHIVAHLENNGCHFADDIFKYLFLY